MYDIMNSVLSAALVYKPIQGVLIQQSMLYISIVSLYTCSFSSAVVLDLLLFTE